MNNNTRKIVVLNKLHSPRIEQAIFILRDEVNAAETDAVSEARKIVDSYIKSLSPNQTGTSKKKSSYKIFIGMTLYTLATSIMTVYLMGLLN